MEAVAAAASSAATFMAAGLWRARAGARERRRRWGAQREGAGVEGEPLARVMEEQGTRRRAALRWDACRPWRSALGAWGPRRQTVEHVACMSVGIVERALGQIWAELDIGPKMKFVHLGLLYIFH